MVPSVSIDAALPGSSATEVSEIGSASSRFWSRTTRDQANPFIACGSPFCTAWAYQ